MRRAHGRAGHREHALTQRGVESFAEPRPERVARAIAHEHHHTIVGEDLGQIHNRKPPHRTCHVGLHDHHPRAKTIGPCRRALIHPSDEPGRVQPLDVHGLRARRQGIHRWRHEQPASQRDLINKPRHRPTLRSSDHIAVLRDKALLGLGQLTPRSHHRTQIDRTPRARRECVEIVVEDLLPSLEREAIIRKTRDPLTHLGERGILARVPTPSQTRRVKGLTRERAQPEIGILRRDQKREFDVCRALPKHREGLGEDRPRVARLAAREQHRPKRIRGLRARGAVRGRRHAGHDRVDRLMLGIVSRIYRSLVAGVLGLIRRFD